MDLSSYFFPETSTPLSGNFTFNGSARQPNPGSTGTWSQWSTVNAAIFADQNGTVSMQYSDDALTWVTITSQIYIASTPLLIGVPVMKPHYRIQFVNGSTPQTVFTVSTGFAR